MLLNKLELEIYSAEQCEEYQLKKIRAFHKRLKLKHLMTLKGMYLIFWRELKVLNLNKIHNFEQLCKKSKGYRRHLKRVKNRQAD